MWALLSALFPSDRHSARVSKYTEHVGELSFKGMTFPIKPSDIPRFEEMNNISVNLFGYEKGELFPIHITDKRWEKHVNLLLLSDGKKNHYCWIKDVDRLLYDQKCKGNRYFFCHYCLHGFTKKTLLDAHIPYCQHHGPQKTEMPKEEDKWLYYKDVSKQLKSSYIIYADFECILPKVQGCDLNPERSSTVKKAHHLPSGFTYIVVGLNEELTSDHVTYRGPDASEVFVQEMIKEEKRILDKLHNPLPLVMTEEDEIVFQTATHCHICQQELGSDRVRDHSHTTGKYRNAAHQACNLNYKESNRIKVVFHNLRSYVHIQMNPDKMNMRKRYAKQKPFGDFFTLQKIGCFYRSFLIFSSWIS